MISDGLELPHGMHAYNAAKKRFVRWLSGFDGPVSENISQEKGLVQGWVLHKGVYLNWSPRGYFEMSSKDSATFNDKHQINRAIIENFAVAPDATATLTHIDEKRHKNGVLKTLGSVRNSFNCLPSDSEDSFSEHEHSKFTYLPVVLPKSAQLSARAETSSTVPTAFDIANATGKQSASKPVQYVHPLQGRHVDITDGVQKGRSGIMMNKCTAQGHVYRAHSPHTRDAQNPEHHMQAVTPQPYNPVVRRPPGFDELHLTFGEHQGAKKAARTQQVDKGAAINFAAERAYGGAGVDMPHEHNR